MPGLLSDLRMYSSGATPRFGGSRNLVPINEECTGNPALSRVAGPSVRTHAFIYVASQQNHIVGCPRGSDRTAGQLGPRCTFPELDRVRFPACAQLSCREATATNNYPADDRESTP